MRRQLANLYFKVWHNHGTFGYSIFPYADFSFQSGMLTKDSRLKDKDKNLTFKDKNLTFKDKNLTFKDKKQGPKTRVQGPKSRNFDSAGIY